MSQDELWACMAGQRSTPCYRGVTEIVEGLKAECLQAVRDDRLKEYARLGAAQAFDLLCCVQEKMHRYSEVRGAEAPDGRQP
jgi:hypothetical protein